MRTIRTYDAFYRYQPRWYGSGTWKFKRPRVYASLWPRVTAKLLTVPLFAAPLVAVFLVLYRSVLSIVAALACAAFLHWSTWVRLRRAQEKYLRPETPLSYWLEQWTAEANSPPPPPPPEQVTIPAPARPVKQHLNVTYTTHPRRCTNCEKQEARAARRAAKRTERAHRAQERLDARRSDGHRGKHRDDSNVHDRVLAAARRRLVRVDDPAAGRVDG